MSPTNDLKSTDSPPHLPPRSAKSFRWWLKGAFGFLAIAAAIVAGFVGIGLAQKAGWLKVSSVSGSGESVGENVIYTCPMDPQIRQVGPGRCPICGMELSPASSSTDQAGSMAVMIDPAQRRLANIQTAPVVQKVVSQTLESIGVIQIDESRQATIASYINGRIEDLFADYTGVRVKKGDHLAVLYSPQLYSAQVEYLEARRSLENANRDTLGIVRDAQSKLVTNAKQRLIELGMTDDQLTNLEEKREAQSRLTIYSPIGGTVIEKMAEEGKYVSAGQPIYRIADLSMVWLMLKLFPEDASRMRFGQKVEARFDSMPGETFSGRVAFVDPTVDQKTRTVGVRVEMLNTDGRLRPGDFARATIQIPIVQTGEVYDDELAGKWISPMHPQIIREEPGLCPICGMALIPASDYGYRDTPVDQAPSLVVPRSAVLMAGQQNVIFVETDPGKFELHAVKLGAVLKDEAVVLEGLEVGQQVATSGNFLIDSQMQLAGKPSLIDVHRHIAEMQDLGEEPLKFENISITNLPGQSGQHMEQLYESYFAIQQALADDKPVPEQPSQSLNAAASSLQSDSSLNESAKALVASVAKSSEHLHHLPIEKARVNFKTISREVITLSTEFRGESAQKAFYHFFCPMVPEGHGDWLQSTELLSNPYFGSEMLRCGELVETIPANSNEMTNPSAPGDLEVRP